MDPQPSATSINTLSGIEKRFKSFSSSQKAQEKDSENENKVFLGILRDACDLVRADPSPAVVERVDAFINSVVDFGYAGGGDGIEIFDYMPSFAHSDEFPELKDSDDGGVAGVCAYMNLDISSALDPHVQLLQRMANSPCSCPSCRRRAFLGPQAVHILFLPHSEHQNNNIFF
jgi:hypothetical protein